MQKPREFNIQSNSAARALKLTRRLIAIDNPRILYLSIPKCGCTFVKNVLWYIQFSTHHSNPIRIHDDDGKFLRASDLNLNSASILQEDSAFTVVRNPIERFISLYFDKIVGKGREQFVPLARTLIAKHGLIENPHSVSDHRYNLEILAAWLPLNLAHSLDMPSEAHWTPQIYRADVMHAFNLRLLTVNKLRLGMEILLRRRVPQISVALSEAEMNRSERSFEKQALLTPSIRKSINSTYSEDRKLFHKVSSAWSDIQISTEREVEIPRFRAIAGQN